MATNSDRKGTGKKPASDAGKLLRSPKTPKKVKDVAASNYSNLSAVTNGTSIAVMSVVDNLNKGAAGGAIQWMNRLLGISETTGLTAAAPGWT